MSVSAQARGRERTIVIAGIVLLWATAVYSVLFEFGDCGGTAEDCLAAAALARDHVRLMAAMVLVITAIGIGALRTGRPIVHVALVLASAVVVLLGLWVVAVPAARPGWLPAGFMGTLPAAMIVCVGAALPLLRARGPHGG